MSENAKTPNNQDELLAEEISARRSEVVQNFQVEFSVDDIPDVEVVYEDTAPSDEDAGTAEVTETKETKEPKKKRRRSKGEGCLVKLIYLLIVLGVSGFLAAMLLFFVLDSLAINREDRIVDFEVEKGYTTADITELLVEKGVIDNSLCFRIYTKLTGADAKWQTGAFTVSPAMDYATLVETLQTMTPRETVTVTIPEGYTIEEIAQVLDKSGACEKENFYSAVVDGQYDYDFLPTGSGKRAYRLEGYLFPDTYEFYKNSSGETVVNRMLENFNNKLTEEIRQQITARGWTIDEAIIVASLVQGEAASQEDMEKVSKVLQNRLDPNSGYPKLELCSTRDYVKGLSPTYDGVVVIADSYNTYDRAGLPVGAINNPGLQALLAALNPSTAEEVARCYFFATDYNTGITYFSQSFSEHERICRKYKIGMYG